MHLHDRTDVLTCDDSNMYTLLCLFVYVFCFLCKLIREPLSSLAAYWVDSPKNELLKQNESTQQEANKQEE